MPQGEAEHLLLPPDRPSQALQLGTGEKRPPAGCLMLGLWHPAGPPFLPVLGCPPQLVLPVPWLPPQPGLAREPPMAGKGDVHGGTAAPSFPARAEQHLQQPSRGMLRRARLEQAWQHPKPRNCCSRRKGAHLESINQLNHSLQHKWQPPTCSPPRGGLRHRKWSVRAA